MSSTDGLTRWLASIEGAARDNPSVLMDAAEMLAVLAVVQAAEVCMAREVWIGYSEGGIRYCNDCEVCWPQSHKPGCSVLAMMNVLAALRALVGEAPWADQEADVQPSRG